MNQTILLPKSLNTGKLKIFGVLLQRSEQLKTDVEIE